MLACIYPGWYQGAYPGTHFTYSFVGSGWTSDLQNCVTNGAISWTVANSNSTGVQFNQSTGGAPSITFSFNPNLPSNIGGGITDPNRDSNGFVTGFGVQFNPANVTNCDGLLKETMHELGHGQGLDDTSGGDIVKCCGSAA
jgi:hypothetical protein